MVTIIGRGHSGTRILAQTLFGSDVYMGRTINAAGDKIPPRDLYEACRIIGRNAIWTGGLSWQFSQLNEMPIPPNFISLLESYLSDLTRLREKFRTGWKLPETTLIYPWLVRLYPQIRYVHLVRDPRDSLLGPHQTDDLGQFGISYPETDDILAMRAASWKYQYEIVRATPPPDHFISVRYEDLVLRQETTLTRLEDFLRIPLARTVVDPERIGKWRSNQHILPYVKPLTKAMREWGYC